MNPPFPAAENGVEPQGARQRTLRYIWLVAFLWIVALSIICARVAISPRRQSVYTADYMPAGRNWLHGEEIYRLRRHFIYSPPTATLMVPFAVLPERLGNVCWRLACALALLWAATAWLRGGLGGLDDILTVPASAGRQATAFLLLLPLAAGNLNLGQMNVLVLVLTTAAILSVHKQRWNLAVLFFACAGYMKIYPLAVGLLVAALYPRKLAWRLGAAVVILFLVSLVLQYPPYVLREYRQWFTLLGGDDRLDVDLYSTWRDFGFLLRAVGVPVSDRLYRYMEAAAGGALALFLLLGQRRWGWTENRLLGGAFALGCAWMVLFGPATEAATYIVLSLAVCSALISVWNVPRPPARGLPAVFALAYVLLLSSDLANAWLHKLAHPLYMRALQPVAALIFTGGIVWWLLRPDGFAPALLTPLSSAEGKPARPG